MNRDIKKTKFLYACWKISRSLENWYRENTQILKVSSMKRQVWLQQSVVSSGFPMTTYILANQAKDVPLIKGHKDKPWKRTVGQLDFKGNKGRSGTITVQGWRKIGFAFYTSCSLPLDAMSHLEWGTSPNTSEWQLHWQGRFLYCPALQIKKH